MLQKTEHSEVSTAAQHKTTSFYTPKGRQMFKQLKKGETAVNNSPFNRISSNNLPNDLLFFEPRIINTLVWPEIFLFENDFKVGLKGNFYEISGIRGKNRFLPRKSEANAEVVFFWAERPAKKMHLISIQRYFSLINGEEFLHNHLNLTKYNPDDSSYECIDLYLNCEKKQESKEKDHEIWDFRSFQTIQNCKKGVMIMKIVNKNKQSEKGLFKILLLDLTQSKKNDQNDKRNAKILTSTDLDCQQNFGRDNETFLKTIKSQFGDLILLITNKEIYELEIEQLGDGYKISLKPYKISKIIAGMKENYLRTEKVIKGQSEQKGNRENSDKISSIKQEIKDAKFISNGLKIMLLTNYEQIIFIEAHNFLFAQNIQQIIENSQISEKYKIDSLTFTNLYSVNGSVGLQFKSKNGINLVNDHNEGQSSPHLKVTNGVILLKIQNNFLSFSKIINFPFNSRESLYVSIRQCLGLDQILIQYIQKKNPFILNMMKCRTLMQELNSMVKMGEIEYNYPRIVDFQQKNSILHHFQPNQGQKRYHTCVVPISSRVIYYLNDKQLTCYKILHEVDAQRTGKQMVKLFSHSFFEKPLKIVVNPLNLHFVIIFKEFVKFFYFNYYSIKNYFTLKMKSVVDVQYTPKGNKLIITCNDGMIYLLDTYSFMEEQILQFYGQPIQAKMIDEKHLLVKSDKKTLTYFEQGWDEEGSRQFIKKYEVKIDEGDHYAATLNNLIIFKRNAVIEVYNHEPQPISNELPEAERQCYLSLQQVHRNLVNRLKCHSFKHDQIATKLLLNEQLGFLFVSTNKGNIKQYLWPLQPPTNPNPPQVFTQQVSSHRILSIELDAKYTYLYAISQNGAIAQLQIQQYINGEQMPYVYIFSEKTRNQQLQKRQFTDRNYFIDNYTPTQLSLIQANLETKEQLQFFVDKLKDDLQEMTKIQLNQNKVKEVQIKNSTKVKETEFKKILKDQESKYSSELQSIRKAIELNSKQAEGEKSKQEERYQKTLLELYKESDRLKRILKTQDQKLSEQKISFKKQFETAITQFNIQKNEQLAQLEKQYKQIEQKKRLAERENEILDKEEDAQMKLFKVKVHQQQQNQLRGEDEYKQKLLGQNAKKEKAINNLRNRANYFQNLILQTKVQISQLIKDQSQYENKKNYLKEELKDKEDIIEKIERQLVEYLKNTQDMKKIKNNHEFELQEYQKQVNPIQDNYKEIQENVKHMNIEIMKEYNHKVNKVDDIKFKNDLINDLKQKKKNLQVKKLQTEGKINRFAEKLTDLVKNTFHVDVKKQLQLLIDSNDKETGFVKLDEGKEKLKKQGEKLLRYKNMIRKQIEEEEKRQEHIIKNQHQFYKYHFENTTLVRQFNELKKSNKILEDQYHRLYEKLSALKASKANTPLKRAPSLNLRKVHDKKLTPFQRYEQEQTSIKTKIQDTTDTKLSRNSQSLSFLKGLMKEVNQTDSKYEKLQVMRERVRTFVNPQLRMKPQQIKKILFGRTRGASEMLKLK